MSKYHTPVLLEPSVQGLIVSPSGVYVDATFGGGGHSQRILECLGVDGRLYAFDQDADAFENKIIDKRIVPVFQNFRHIKEHLRFLGVQSVDGIIADLGVSSHQFDEGSRGFSIRFDAPLDMRMNVGQKKSAETVVNEYEEEHLSALFYQYGELRESRKIARIIVHNRKTKPISTTFELMKLFDFIPKHKSNTFFAKLFQAIRIEVNDELEALKQLLLSSKDLIKPTGRLVVISYHSLEDRLVKRFMKTGLFEGEPERDVYGNWESPFHVLQSKPIVPTEQEMEENPRARSAKLRIAVRNDN